MPAWFVAFATHPVALLTVGGAAGTNARYWLGRWLQQAWGGAFPLGTFVINVAGSFLVGLAAVFLLERLPRVGQTWFLLAGTGFCGGFTTFSAFELETYQLLQQGRAGLALLYVLGSVAAGLAAVAVGVLAARVVLTEG